MHSPHSRTLTPSTFAPSASSGPRYGNPTLNLNLDLVPRGGSEDGDGNGVGNGDGDAVEMDDGYAEVLGDGVNAFLMEQVVGCSQPESSVGIVF